MLSIIGCSNDNDSSSSPSAETSKMEVVISVPTPTPTLTALEKAQQSINTQSLIDSLTRPDVDPSTQIGQGILAHHSRDYNTARELLIPLANQNNPDAQFYVGLMYRKGTGVIRDDRTSGQLFKMAAEQGHAGAMDQLVTFYWRGEGGFTQNYFYAHMWANISASLGYEGHGRNKGTYGPNTSLRSLEKHHITSPADLDKAQQLARECVAKAYKNCSP